jgi:DNA-binding NarL/FixJ family response regulator
MNAPYTNSDPCWRGLGVLDGAKVLLVEDDPATRWLVRSALRDKCRLATANTANKAFSICQSYKPDIVFLDIGLPDKSGCEVLKWLARNDPGVQVIIFSGCTDLNIISGALESGARGFIAKPFTKESFLSYIGDPADTV